MATKSCWLQNFYDLFITCHPFRWHEQSLILQCGHLVQLVQKERQMEGRKSSLATLGTLHTPYIVGPELCITCKELCFQKMATKEAALIRSTLEDAWTPDPASECVDAIPQETRFQNSFRESC